jgi:hypothetical protein
MLKVCIYSTGMAEHISVVLINSYRNIHQTADGKIIMNGYKSSLYIRVYKEMLLDKSMVAVYWKHVPHDVETNKIFTGSSSVMILIET